ncbi:trace amine-associated receptor 1-like [Centropristis striata]|uniref:trace amine-associated receptor 1-like n=1 Tax=Centropristis striata TaxID=184440 RepID=UPI0027DF5390|nr:trace amine-associated receptor 1-like [Centropristis striata]
MSVWESSVAWVANTLQSEFCQSAPSDHTLTVLTEGFIRFIKESFGQKTDQLLLLFLKIETMEEAELCFPQLLNSSCRRPEPPHFDTVLIYLLLSFIALLTAALNLLVIISISHFRQLHTPTNLLLLSLAVSDFLVGLFGIPVEILMMQTCWMLCDLMCSLYYLFAVIIIAASLGNMVLISVDRYVAICDPLHYPTKVTQKVVGIFVYLCWICSTIYGIILSNENLKHPGRYKSCYGECMVNIPGNLDLIVGFIIPVALIIVLYMRVFVVAVSQARAMRSHTATVSLQHSKTVKVKRSELKAARTLGILVVVFLICYSPFYCVSLTGHNILIGSSTEDLIAFLMYFNSCLNPVIYVFFYPWFKKTIRLVVTFQILQPDSREAQIL